MSTFPRTRPIGRPLLRLIGGLTVLVALGACGAEAQSSDTRPVEQVDSAVKLVDVAAGLSLVADPTVAIVDVRTPAEFADGHIERAELIDFESADFRDRIVELDRTVTYFVYCRSGNRSAQATAIMAELGFRHVFELDGGMIAWQAAGAPVSN